MLILCVVNQCNGIPKFAAVPAVNLFSRKIGNKCYITIVLIASLIVFSNSIFMDFVWDDLLGIANQDQKTDLISYIANTGKGLMGDALQHETPYFRPICSVAGALFRASFGKRPWPYHLSSMIIHALNSLLIFLVVTEMNCDVLVAFLSSLFFAVHPIHSEAVTYISALGDPLCAFFILLSMYAFLLFINGNGLRYYLYSLVIFLLALMTKEMAVAFPAAIVFCCASRGSGLINTFRLAASFFMLTILYLIIRAVMLQTLAWNSPPFLVRFQTMPIIIVTYLRELTLPFGLKVLYDVPVQFNLFSPSVLLSLSGVILVLVYSLMLIRKSPDLSFSIFWLITAMFPVSGLPSFIEPSLISDRYLYVPSVGFSICSGLVVGSLIRFLQARKLTGVAALTVSALLLLLSFSTFSRNVCWRDDLTLSSKMIEDSPGHPLGYYRLASYYSKKGSYAEAMALMGESLRCTIRQQNELALGYLRMGYYELAEKKFWLLLDLGADKTYVYGSLENVYRKLGRIPRHN